MRSLLILTVLAAALACVAAAQVHPCGQWVLYKQCGEKWSNHALGTSTTETICDAGCAMSSVAMSLATYRERVDGKHTDPGTLNSWLVKHGGYVDTDLIVWNAVAKLGKLSMKEDVHTLSRDDIRRAADRCEPVIANVRDGSHWVLITGYDTADKDTFYVNDPGFSSVSYAYSGMSNFVVYSNRTMAALSAAVSAEADAAAHQPAPASIVVAATARSTANLPLLRAERAAAPTPAPLSGLYGVDVSQPTDTAAFQCMKDQHAVSFVIIRSYMETGASDPSVAGTAKAARAAGINVGVYHFPDTRQDASSQVSNDLSYLRSHGVSIDEFWIDVERSDWGSNHTFNTHFIRDECETAKAGTSALVGVYTSESQWTPITGGSPDLADFALWWATYNYEPNFDGFSAFGGWNSPYMHQYKGNQMLCGAGVDVNWRP